MFNLLNLKVNKSGDLTSLKVPVRAYEHVQYDQGEDRWNRTQKKCKKIWRWLCTLMLQQGWRVEYSAASDSYTGDLFNSFLTHSLLRWDPIQESHRHDQTWAANPIYPMQIIAAHFVYTLTIPTVPLIPPSVSWGFWRILQAEKAVRTLNFHSWLNILANKN